MGWLIAIWLFAAFCGWLVHVAYEPVLEIAASLAYSVSPELVGPIAALAGTPGLQTVAAIGTALTIGLVLTGIWFVIRLVTGAGRRIASPRTPPERRSPEPVRRNEADWQLDPSDRARDPKPSRTEPTGEPVSTAPPRDPFDPGPAPRWGRQPTNERDA